MSDNSTDEKMEDKQSAIEKVIELIEAVGVELFHDQYKVPHIKIEGKPANIFELRSLDFKDWLAHTCYSNNIFVATETLRRAIDILAGRARFDGKELPLYVRIKRNPDKPLIWYDLGEKVVGINDRFWQVMDAPTVMFRHFQHQVEQVIPEEGGDVFELLKFVNLPNEDDGLLFLIYLITAFIPGYAHPLLVLYGPPGSGKSTPFRVLKELIDPSLLKRSLALPYTEKDFAHIAAKHYLLVFDNLSDVKPIVSDILAKACYGDGFSTRALYTNDDDFVRIYQPRIAINGINQVITRADLLDRTILLHLERISDNYRIDEETFWKNFEDAKPKILGAIFDTLSKSLKIYPTLPDMPKNRMASFQLWACAVTEALGIDKERFIKLYNANVAKQHDEAIAANVLAMAIVTFMQDKEAWSGEPSLLLDELKIALNRSGQSNVSGLPSNSVWLSRRMAYIEMNLTAIGLKITRHENARLRLISIVKDASFTVDTDTVTGSPEQQSLLSLVQGILGPSEILNNFDDVFVSDTTDSKDAK